jgi:hypothetical protein
MTFLYPAWWPGAFSSAGLLGNSRISNLRRAGNTGEGVGGVAVNSRTSKSEPDQRARRRLPDAMLCLPFA